MLALVDKATWYLRQGKLNQAQAAYEVANQITPAAQVYDGLGAVAMLRGNTSQAESLFKAALRLDPNYSEALGNLALLYDQSARPALAAKYYELAVSANPANFRVRNNYAVFRFEQDGSAQAAEHALFSANALVEHPIIEKNLLFFEKDMPHG